MDMDVVDGVCGRCGESGNVKWFWKLKGTAEAKRRTRGYHAWCKSCFDREPVSVTSELTCCTVEEYVEWTRNEAAVAASQVVCETQPFCFIV
jgi:hypothetical protein